MKSESRRAQWLLLLALACVILGAKFIQIDRAGSDLPFWDQWDAEGDSLLRPYLEGHLPARNLVALHNEHRILFTRLLALGLFTVNDRQWDARLELVANAVVATALALLLAGMALRLRPWGPAGAYVTAVAIVFSTAVDWENTLGAFQSQFYFLILFSALHIGGTLLARPRSWLWWLAPLAGAAALFSMGSGGLSALALLGCAGLRAVRERKLTREDAWVLAANAALFAAGWLLRGNVAAHDSLKAPTVGSGLDTWLRQLAWPVLSPWAAPLALVPPLALGWAYLRRRIAPAPALALLGACAWFWLQAGAIAYARGVDHGYASRYTDILIAGLLVNLFTLGFLAAQASGAARRGWLALGALFAVATLAGLGSNDRWVRQNIFPLLRTQNAARIETVRSYLSDRDPAFFQRVPVDELPYPSAVRLAGLLDNPVLRRALPVSVRTPPPFVVGQAVGLAPGQRPGPQNDETAGDIPFGLRAWRTRSRDGGIASTSDEFISEPFVIDHHLLSIFVAGDQVSHLRMSLIDEQGIAHPPRDTALTPTRHWKRVNFIAPKGLARLEVAVSARWFAFTQPITDTALSRFAVELAASGAWFLGIGAALYLAALFSVYPPQNCRPGR